MRRSRVSSTMLAGLMALALALTAMLQPGVTMAQAALTGQASSSQTVGDSTVSFTDEWSFDPSLSNNESLLLSHQQLPGTLFLYSEFTEPGTPDPAVVVDEFAGGFFSEFGDGNQQTVASGTVQTGSAWELFTVDQSGIPFGLILVADVPPQTSMVSVSVLLGPRGSFDLATQAAIDGIDVNGTGSPLDGLDPAELDAALNGTSQLDPTSEPAQPEQTATQTTGGLTLPPLNPTLTSEPAQPEQTATQTPEQAQPEETATQTTGGLTLPPLSSTQTPEQAQPAETATQTTGGLTLPPLSSTQTPEQAQPAETATQTTGGLALPTETPESSTGGQTSGGNEITVGDVVLRYGEGWTYSEEISTPNETAFFSRDASTLAIFAFATVANAEGDDAITGLQEFNSGFFAAFGAVDVHLVESEVLPSGVAYSVNSAMYNGLPITVLAYADVTSAPGQFQVQVLIALADEFDDTLTDARGALQIDDVVIFSDLDPAAISGQPDTGAAVPSTTTPETQPVVDISQYEVQDAADACDSIGWVVTSTGQMSTTEQDVSFRSACVGGGTYFAACGITEGNQFFAPEPGMQWIRCDVAVRPDSESLEVSFIDFSLIDGNGTRYTFDLLGMAALENGVDFPEGPVEGGQTATGSVVFSVLQGVSTPLVLEIAPFALLAGGGEPGTLVIADELQPFEMLGP